MKFNIPFKRKFNVWYKKFAWLPKRMTSDPNIVIWLGFYWTAMVCYYRYVVYLPKNYLNVTSTDTNTRAVYPISLLNNTVSSTDGF